MRYIAKKIGFKFNLRFGKFINKTRAKKSNSLKNSYLQNFTLENIFTFVTICIDILL